MSALCFFALLYFFGCVLERLDEIKRNTAAPQFPVGTTPDRDSQDDNPIVLVRRGKGRTAIQPLPLVTTSTRTAHHDMRKRTRRRTIKV